MRYLPPALVVLLFVTRSVEMAVRHGAVRGRITHPGTWWALFLGGSLTVAAALAEYFLQPHPVNRLLVCTGVAIGIASFALRGWAAAHLRAYWSMHIEVRDDHPLVTDGPYGWVRHPIYTAAALELVGAIVTLQSWWSLIVLAVAFIPAVTLPYFSS